MTRFGPPTALESALEVMEIEDGLLLTAVLLLPWAFGGVEIWAYRSAAMLIALAAAFALARDGWGALGLNRKSRWLLPALLLGGWAIVQVVPLPPPVVAFLSPSADAIYRDTFPGYPGPPPDSVLASIEQRALDEVPEAAAVPVPTRSETFFGGEAAGRWSGWRPISLLPQAGIERVIWYFALLMAFLLVRERTRDPERGYYYRNLFFGCFVGLALFGLVYAATSNGALYWVRPIRQESHPFGPYVNPVNFAAVMEMAVPWILGYALLVWRRTGAGWRSLLRSPIFLVGAVVCLVAALAAASKAAALLLAVSLSLLLLVAVRRMRSRLIVVALIVLLVAGATVTLRETRLAERIEQLVDTTGGDLESIDRLVILKSAVPMLRDYPVTGAGFGSFREVFGRYLPRGEFLVWEQLHNDYVELLAEGGAIAGALLLWLILAYWSRVLRPSVWTGGRHVDLEHLGLALGLLSLSLHAFVDFNHQIPANALLFVALAGMLASRAERRLTAKAATGKRA